MEEKINEKIEDKKNENRGEHMSSYIISKRGLWLMAGGALGALAVIGFGKLSKKIRPAAVGAVKEGYSFSEWLMAKCEKAKEDIEDIVAEAKHAHQKDLETTAETVKKEEDILKKVEQMVEDILRQRSKKEET
ncbi:MAG: hypothetical protein NUV74_15980 [Candidatus Brocadiaceae bacterium]|nr:hypothetical protein [Candidatus Brocadiaceae bacterium]